MPTLKRLCVHPGCGSIAAKASTLCPEHRAASARRKAERDRMRPSPEARGYDQKWRRIRAQFLKHNPHCDCGAKATEVDHIRPLAKGGTHAWSNLQAKCKRHHSQKTIEENRGEGGRVMSRW